MPDFTCTTLVKKTGHTLLSFDLKLHAHVDERAKVTFVFASLSENPEATLISTFCAGYLMALVSETTFAPLTEEALKARVHTLFELIESEFPADVPSRAVDLWIDTQVVQPFHFITPQVEPLAQAA